MGWGNGAGVVGSGGTAIIGAVEWASLLGSPMGMGGSVKSPSINGHTVY